MEEKCRRTDEEQESTKETDEDKNERGKDLEHEICVITWNVSKSSAQHDLLRDMAQCQAHVVMFQKTLIWQDDGTGEEMRWTLLKDKKEGKAASAVKKQEYESFETFSQKYKMGTCCSGKYPVSIDVLAAHVGW